MGSNEEAAARVDALFARFRGREVPIWTGDLRSVGPDQLDDARERAFRAAGDAGRGEMLDAALDRIERAYAMRAADGGFWTGIYAVAPPWDSASRAHSQMALEDLVIALMVEDAVPASVFGLLRVDGERLLRLPPPGAEPAGRQSEEQEAAEDDGQPPIEPFTGPLVFVVASAGLGLLALVAIVVLGLLVGGIMMGLALVALVAMVRRITSNREREGSP